jgi:isocitrate dehydrogenase (NAD+)
VVIVREINEDVYVASEYTAGDDTAVALKIITRKSSETVVRFAFEFAKSSGRSKVTAVHKANVLKQTDGLFVRVAREIANDYREIEFDERFIELARAVYFTNDKRSEVKKKLNLHLGSQIIEEKSYQDYS